MAITITKTYSVEQIKKILIKEEESFLPILRERAVFSERAHFYVDMAIEKINACKTEEELNDFIYESRRMSINEWVNSL